MEIRIYDPNLDRKGSIENQSSFIWTRRYTEAGEFELHCPITDRNKELLKMGYIVGVKGFNEAGVIETMVMEESVQKNEITCSGRFLTGYMDGRISGNTTEYSGYAEVIMRTLLTEATVPIPLVELGELQGFTEEVAFQMTYKNLLTYMSKIAKACNLGFRFRPDFNEKKIIFEVYKGTDKSQSQGVQNRVIFSQMYENLNSAQYTESSRYLVTKVFVGGKGEGASRVVVTVGGGTGLNLKEAFVSAVDISSDGLTDAQYRAALEERGLEYLEENSYVKSFEYETDPSINFTYKTDYDLGDIVTVKKESWNVQEDMRITEIQEVYENGAMKVVPTLGNPLPTTIDWEDK